MELILTVKSPPEEFFNTNEPIFEHFYSIKRLEKDGEILFEGKTNLSDQTNNKYLFKKLKKLIKLYPSNWVERLIIFKYRNSSKINIHKHNLGFLELLEIGADNNNYKDYMSYKDVGEKGNLKKKVRLNANRS